MSEEASDRDGMEEDEREEIDSLHLTEEDIVPPHLKEIGGLASWTVSSHKPGNGVAALRHPSTMNFWQSDGPQPHTLNVHFFKMVSIAYLRLYLDFDLDESYTPSGIEVWAGTGHHDLVMLTSEVLERPKGWLDLDLQFAGGPTAKDEGWLSDVDAEADRDDELVMAEHDSREGRAAKLKARAKSRRKGLGPTLRCFLLQLRILENHQNGKDTHLRALQIFARDEAMGKKRIWDLPDRSSQDNGVENGTAFHEALDSDEHIERRTRPTKVGTKRRGKGKDKATESAFGLYESDWMKEPEIR